MINSIKGVCEYQYLPVRQENTVYKAMTRCFSVIDQLVLPASREPGVAVSPHMHIIGATILVSHCFRHRLWKALMHGGLANSCWRVAAST